jgi:roadblock/LC7 domain-containing protein
MDVYILGINELPSQFCQPEEVIVRKTTLVMMIAVMVCGASLAYAGDKLDRLMSLPGAVAVGEFTPDGKLVRYKGQLSKEAAEMAAMMCGSTSSLFAKQSDDFSAKTGMKWTPFKGFAVSAGEFSVCAAGNTGLFVETAKADFNKIFQALAEN